MTSLLRSRDRIPMTDILIPVSCGELIDKITILEIKREKVDDPGKRANIARELDALQRVCRDALADRVAQIEPLARRLKAVNLTLWTIEDDLRDMERAQIFDADFIALARAVYVTNDERAGIKKDIDRALGSSLTEEKLYRPYV
jgi:hypothetical protein